MNQFTYNKHQVCWYEEGEGTPLILLHGFCEDARMWESLLTRIGGCRVIRIDLPGFGHSEAFEHISIDGMAEIVKAVADQLQLKKHLLLGHSMGGYVATAYARKYPETLMGLGLIHSHPYNDTEVGKAGRNKGIEFIRKHGHVTFVRQLMPILFPSAFQSKHPNIINQLVERAAAGPEAGIRAAIIAMRDRPDSSAALKRVNCPVLFIVGKEDAVIPLEAGLQQLSLPAIADIHILEGVGHMGMFEAPYIFSDKIQGFIHFCQSTS